MGFSQHLTRGRLESRLEPGLQQTPYLFLDHAVAALTQEPQGVLQRARRSCRRALASLRDNWFPLFLRHLLILSHSVHVNAITRSFELMRRSAPETNLWQVPRAQDHTNHRIHAQEA